MILLVVVFLLSFLLTWIYREYALYKSLLDVPNERSSHTFPIPKGGGLAVAIAWFLGILYLFITKQIENSLFYAFLSGLPLVIIGFIDDLFNLKPIIRFIVQIIVAGLGLYFLEGIYFNQLSFVNCRLLIIILTFAAIIWSINLFNFLDGIDGYLGSEIVFIGISLFILTGDNIGLLLAVSVSGFLIWNWPKAKIFIGDTGSTLLGYIVAILILYYHNVHQTSITVGIILASVFWLDATITIFRRIINKEAIFKAHQKHAYQRIVKYGYSHQKTLLYSILINLICFGLAYLANTYHSLKFIFLFIDLLLLTLIYAKIEKLKPYDKQR